MNQQVSTRQYYHAAYRPLQPGFCSLLAPFRQ
jgi:hypothetical protein